MKLYSNGARNYQVGETLAADEAQWELGGVQTAGSFRDFKGALVSIRKVRAYKFVVVAVAS